MPPRAVKPARLRERLHAEYFITCLPNGTRCCRHARLVFTLIRISSLFSGLFFVTPRPSLNRSFFRAALPNIFDNILNVVHWVSAFRCRAFRAGERHPLGRCCGDANKTSLLQNNFLYFRHSVC